MVWIIGATILNTVWTLWCVQLLPARIAVRFGPNGQIDGWMSRQGFAAFSIVTPIATSAFLVLLGKVLPSPGGMANVMEHLAAGLTLFFSFLSWCIVRSNRKTPAQVDNPSLILSVIALLVVFLLSFARFSNAPDQSHPVSGVPASSQN